MTSGESISRDLESLEDRIDDLIGICRRLREENESLRVNRETLLQERTKLAEKNKLAKSRLESIVGRLKSLEKAT